MNALQFLYNPPQTQLNQLETIEYVTKQRSFMKIIEAGMKIFLSMNHQVCIHITN